MKITCPKCTAQYEVNSSLIPPSGVMMRCPACLHTFPVRPDAAPSLGNSDEEFTPPGAQHRPRPQSPAPPAQAKSPRTASLPLSAGMVSPIGPVPPSVHDTAQDAELPAPKHAGGRAPSLETGHRTEAADLPAPKRPGAGRPQPEARSPAAQSQHLVLDVELEDLPAPLKPPPGRRPAGESLQRPRSEPPSDADLLAPIGPGQRQRRVQPPAPDLESPSGSTIPELPAPVGPGPSRRAPRRSGKPASPQSPELQDLDAGPWGQSGGSAQDALSGEENPIVGVPAGSSRGSLKEGHASGRLEQPRLSPVTKLGLADPMQLEDQSSWPELPAPVHAELPSPVHAELPSPVQADLMSPVQADLMTPVRPELPNPVSGKSRGLDLSSFGSQVMPRQPLSVVPTLDTLGVWPPPPGTLKPPTSGATGARTDSIPGLSMEDNSEQLTRPILPGERDAPPAGRSIARGDGPQDDPLPGMGLGLGPAGSTINDLGHGLSMGAPDLGLSLAAGPQAAAPQAAAPQAAAHPGRRRRLILAALAAALLVLAGGGVAGYLLLWRGHRSAEDQARVDQAMRLLGDDMLPSYKKAGEALHLVSGANPDDYGVLALEALARLGQVRYGVVGEQRNAEDRLGQIPAEQRQLPEAVKAKAVLDLLTGKLPEARRALEPLARSAVGRRDPMAPVYLGWVEMRAGKYDAAQKAFQAALNINTRLPAALYGLAQAKDKAGDQKGANAAYLRVRAVIGEHFGASVGQILTGEDADNEAKLLDLMTKKQRNAGPRELAELWAMLGLRARDQSRWKDAEERLRRALQADPSQPVAQVALAQISCNKEKYPEAAALAQQAFKADPKNVEAGLVLVRALMSQKKPLDAGAPLAAIVKLSPKDPRVLYWQGRREEDVAAPGGDAKAEVLYKKALEADGKYLDAYLALFRVLSRMGKTTDALAALKQAAALAQGDPALATTLGEAYLAASQPQKAEESFRMALGLKADLHTARMGLATALEQQGQLEAASKELTDLEARAKTYPGLTERQARVALLQGRYAQAEALYLKAAQEPGSTQDLRLEAAFYNLKSHTQDADALVEAVLRDNPRSLRGQMIMAALKLQEGQLSEALVHAEMASRLGEQPELHLTRARVFLQQNKVTEAVSELEKARKAPVEGVALALHARLLAGQNMQVDALAELTDLTDRQKVLFQDRTFYRPEEVTKLVGEAYLLQGDLQAIAQRDEKALHAYELAARTLPESGEAAFKYGKLLYGASKRQPAIKELQRGLQLGGDKPPYLLEATLILADALRETRRKPEALRYYKRWLELAPPTAPERAEVQGYVLNLGG